MKKGDSKQFLPEFVYGATDGTVTTFAVVAGVMGASLSSAIVLILGFANLFADGFSMAISDYLSSKAENRMATRHVRKHHPECVKEPKSTALVTFFSFLIIGFIPLLPFVLGLFIPAIECCQFKVSIILTAIAFLIIGAIKGKVVDKSYFAAAFETLTIGGIAAALAYGVGYFLRGLVG